MGRRLLVPKIPFHGMLGITGTVTARPAQTSDLGAELPRAREPYVDWPAADRVLWERAFCDDDPFAERPAKATQDHCMWSWRRFLGFLANNDPAALEEPPAERLTIARAKLLARHLSETNAPNSVASLIEALYTAARVVMPDHDWDWLKAIKARLHAATLAHSPTGPVITSVQLLELGLKLMDENKPQPDTCLDLHRAVAYRDGLMIAVLAYVPIRPRNLTSLEIGRHLVLERGRWVVLVPREETKSGKRIQFEVPEILIPYLNIYLENIRPGMLAGKTHMALWVSPKGGALSYVGIVKSFARLATRLGVRISPHDVRDAAVTTWAIARPDQIGVARDLLYHTNPDTAARHYNRAQGIEASRSYRQVISEIRRRRTNSGFEETQSTAKHWLRGSAPAKRPSRNK
jgi:integrase